MLLWDIDSHSKNNKVFIWTFSLESMKNLIARLREYRANTQIFDENQEFMYSQSGFLFHDEDELKNFTNEEDSFLHAKF